MNGQKKGEEEDEVNQNERREHLHFSGGHRNNA